MKLALVAVAAAVVALPPPSFRASGYPLDLAGAGPRVAVVTSQCVVRVSAFAADRKFVTVRPPAACTSGEAGTDGVWLGKAAVAVQTIDAPSPHGESYGLWVGSLPRGPLRQRGDDWGWTDSDVPGGYGCAWSVAAGGGVIAMVQVPNRLAVDLANDEKPACPAGPSARISLVGAARTQVVVAGSWDILATDGKRLLLARLDADALQTGELALVGIDGKRLAAPAVPAAVVRAAYDGWLTPDGLVLETPKSIVGPGWTVKTDKSVTVGYGRIFYMQGRMLRVRRIRGGADRPLLRLPTSEPHLAAGSFGVAMAMGAESTRVYRLPWSTVDRTLPQRS
ncbi:MAG: hypothetical protein QOE36_3388 [Gaiellaceae bacterium]|nr:hypothetical protein [Gaiellaceae bacterium]